MSSRSNRRKRRQAITPIFDTSVDVPLLVERVKQQQQEAGNNGKSYEEANWARLSPLFRAAHNRLLAARGLPEIPPPKVDLYTPPPRILKPFNPNDPEFIAVAREFLGPTLMGGGNEGFEIKKA